MTTTPFLKRYSDLVAPVLALLGIVVGATVSHFWTQAQMLEQQRLERTRTLEMQHLELKKAAYNEFLKGQTLLWSAPDKTAEANQLINGAKLNILLTGPKDVVCAMTSYWAVAAPPQACPDPGQRRQDASIYQEMRRDFFRALDVRDDPALDAAVIVSYLWSCSLAGPGPDASCQHR